VLLKFLVEGSGQVTPAKNLKPHLNILLHHPKKVQQNPPESPVAPPEAPAATPVAAAELKTQPSPKTFFKNHHIFLGD
jgi:hypothetical protein